MTARRCRAGLLVVLTVAVALAAGATPAGAKRVPPCPLLTPEELEPIFEQPFGRGRLEQGDACRWVPPSEADVPEIVVNLRAERHASTKKAKRAFRQSADITAELSSAGVTEVQRVGDAAFYAFFVGTDQLTVRVGRVVVELSVDEPGDAEATYPEQVVAIGQLLATKLSAIKP